MKYESCILHGQPTFMGRFQVGDKVRAGEKAYNATGAGPGTLGVITKIYTDEKYSITWENKRKTEWFDYMGWIEPLESFVTKKDLVKNYEV